MIGQSLYYLNNKKYITNTQNVETVIGELNSFYHTAEPRRITIVHPDIEDAFLQPAEYELLANNARANAASLLDFEQWEDVANADYIQNSDKRILMFTDEEDMIKVFAKYTAGLLTDRRSTEYRTVCCTVRGMQKYQSQNENSFVLCENTSVS